MAHGCVVIADPRFISGATNLFKPGVHYCPIDAELSGAALADELIKINRRTTTAEYTKMQKAARSLLSRFNRKELGQQIVDLANKNIPAEIRTASVVTPKEAKAEFTAIFGE
jgi:hypothetical protein